MTIVEFLLARIADDESDALFADAVTDKRENDWQDVIQPLTFAQTLKREPWSEKYGHAYQHIARHDPARVLAECEAKRRIVGLHAPLDGEECDPSCGDIMNPCATLAALALPYADHADYDESWRP